MHALCNVWTCLQDLNIIVDISLEIIEFRIIITADKFIINNEFIAKNLLVN